MDINYSLPPEPRRNAVLKRIYPWDEYESTLIIQWLYNQALKSGFSGTFEDFKQRYGTFISAIDSQDYGDLIENYTGTYHIIPLIGIDQILQTKNKVLNNNIVVEAVPASLICNHKYYNGNYSITPSALINQVLKTKNYLMDNNIIIEKISYREEQNSTGGYTAIIGQDGDNNG